MWGGYFPNMESFESTVFNLQFQLSPSSDKCSCFTIQPIVIFCVYYTGQVAFIVMYFVAQQWGILAQSLIALIPAVWMILFKLLNYLAVRNKTVVPKVQRLEL